MLKYINLIEYNKSDKLKINIFVILKMFFSCDIVTKTIERSRPAREP